MMSKVLLCLVLLLGVSLGQSVNFTTYFTGGLPFCTQCGTVGQYACSPDANGQVIGQWNNGIVSFTDPVPSGNYATRLQVTVTGAYACNVAGKRAMFGISLNGNILGVRDSSKGSNQCRCDTCDGAEVFDFVFRNGIPDYKYKSTNSLKLEMMQDSICVNNVFVSISYSPLQTSPPTPLPEDYIPITIPVEYDRVSCSVCNSGRNQWCSAYNNNTVSLSFKDPLPANALLIAVDTFMSVNLIQRASSYLTTVSSVLQSTSVGTVTISETNWKEQCGCLADYQSQSATYQRGWPGYVAAGTNKITLTANKYSQSYGNVCIGRLAIKLIYYQLVGDEWVLDTLNLEQMDFEEN